jgi:KEOPS complex subunit Cgi121
MIAGERHLHFAVGKALRAVASGSNVAKDPGIEIMRYAAGERQIERSFSIGLHEGENNVVFVLLGTIDNMFPAFSEIRKLIEEKPCSELLAYSGSKRKGILSLFRITDEEIEASGEEHIPELVIERVALANFVK